MEEINIEVAKNKVESMVGVIGDKSDEIWRKGVILQTGGGPEYAGPRGRIVWDDDYVGKHPSIVRTKVPRKLPASWTLYGDNWLANATKRMKVYYGDYLAKAASKIPPGFFAMYLSSG